MRLLPALAAALLAAASMTHGQAQPAPAPSGLHLFLLIGQSNMAGRGTVTPTHRVPDARVLMLDRSGAWVPALDPMHFDKPSAGVGLGRSFAARVADATRGITVGLIPAAVGGSPIDAWRPGVFYGPTKSHPWDDAMARTRIAMRAGTLKAVLWHQGESDAIPELAVSYEAKLHDLVARVRAALKSPDLPFIVGQLGRFPDAPWTDAHRAVDAAHRALPSRVPRTAYVSSDGLTHGGDKLHFDADSLREFGRRYAEAYRRLTASSRP